jgi:hypothetical protein
VKHQEKANNQERRQKHPGRGLEPDVVKKKLAHGMRGRDGSVVKNKTVCPKMERNAFSRKVQG